MLSYLAFVLFFWFPFRVELIFGSDGKEAASKAGDPGSILDGEDHLEKGVTTRSSIPAWRDPWTEEPDGLQFIGSHRVGQE